MPDVAKLKKKAAEFELKKQFDKALAVYVEILDSFDASQEELDVALFNRVGDLYLKQGSVGDAVDYYEQAVDHYAEGGFFNNAIALCNKILRNSPGRASVYYKLGKISAQKGFKGDAKKNFLEYADRMQSAGKIDEAFRALKEFADLCPDQDDIRLMLADQLSKKGRGVEAIEQLQLLYIRYKHEGREAEARAAVDRMKAIDPTAEPRELGDAPRRSRDDLVFLDLSDGPSKRASMLAKRATLGLEILDTGEHPDVRDERSSAPAPVALPVSTAPPAPLAPPPQEILQTPALDPAVLDGMTRAAEFERGLETPSAGGLLEGLESTAFGSSLVSDSSPELLDFEPTSLGGPIINPRAASPDMSSSDLLEFDLPDPEPPQQFPPAAAPPSGPFASIPDLAQIHLRESDFEEQRAAADAERSAREEAEARAAAERDARRDAEPPRHMRPSLAGLPMLVDDENEQSVRDQQTRDDEEGSIGGELELIMPEGTPIRGVSELPDPLADLPLMDLPLPMQGEALAGVTGSPRVSMELDALAIEGAENSIDDTGEDAEDVAIAEDDPNEPALPPARRQSTMLAEQDVDLLKALCEADSEDNALRRRLAEAMLESGDREGGLRELEAAMVGFERADELMLASKVADEIVLLSPGSVRHHQKRVEYAFRTNERGRLIEAYLQLADALFTAGQVEKSRAIYQRVIDLSPDDMRAQAALESFPEPEPPPPPPPPAKGRSTTAVPRASTSTVTPAIPSASPRRPLPAALTGDEEYVNLGDWLRGDDLPKDTRMVVEEQEPTGDEEADFQDMLRKFKQGISENVEEEDHQSHYDLGVAFKEMGLLDEAIAEFQKALRAPSNRVPTYEALGHCFIEKEQYPMAATILSRGLHEPGMSDDQLVGILYLLGRCAEERGQRDAAIEFYQRVFVVDIQFRDVGDRLAAVEGAPS